MNLAKCYYSLVQYCPDLARQEAVNVGVVLLCPEAEFLQARLVRKNKRAVDFFGTGTESSQLLEAMKQALWNRLEVEREQMLTLAGFQAFVNTRGNDLLLTSPKPLRTERTPAAELDFLYTELVEGDAAERATAQPSRSKEVAQQLDLALSSPRLQPFLRKNVTVKVPALQRAVEVPYGYQNGRFNLVQPVNFHQKAADKVGDAACRYAVEGDSLFGHKDDEWGDMQLVVVAKFRADAEQGRKVVTKMFEDYHVRLLLADEAGTLEEEILAHGKPLAF
jgi:hypothetical protein